MGVGQVSVAAADATVGTDLFAGQWFQQVGYPRVLTGFAIKGSTAANDTKVDLFVDTVKVGTFYNTGTGFPNMDDVFPLRIPIPPNAQIHCYVQDAPDTNPINVMVVTAE